MAFDATATTRGHDTNLLHEIHILLEQFNLIVSYLSNLTLLDLFCLYA
jgi:hypothetical protein